MKAGPRKRGAGAFTLIEIMVVVVILGILAATIIPQFIGTTHDAKVSAAKSHIAELESALERFNVHLDRYPTTDDGLKVLKEGAGGYVQPSLRDSNWGDGVPGVETPGYSRDVPPAHRSSNLRKSALSL